MASPGCSAVRTLALAGKFLSCSRGASRSSSRVGIPRKRDMPERVVGSGLPGATLCPILCALESLLTNQRVAEMLAEDHPDEGSVPDPGPVSATLDLRKVILGQPEGDLLQFRPLHDRTVRLFPTFGIAHVRLIKIPGQFLYSALLQYLLFSPALSSFVAHREYLLLSALSMSLAVSTKASPCPM